MNGEQRQDDSLIPKNPVDKTHFLIMILSLVVIPSTLKLDFILAVHTVFSDGCIFALDGLPS